jgi:prepilin-type N-terminal cleavage/methylation domain-containing protein
MVLTSQIVVTCDRCRRERREVECTPGLPMEAEPMRDSLAAEGWTRQGAGRLDFCPSCSAAAARNARAGFTLVELLVVIAILGGLIATGAVVYRRPGPTEGAAVVQAALVEARNLAVHTGGAGVRLAPDPAWEPVRLADGSIDPAAPIAYSILAPLDLPPPYQTGMVSVHSDGFPAGFVPLPNRLVLEESTVDAEGRRAEPTTWAWNVRVGDAVQYLGHAYTVTGPTAIPIGPANPEAFVNFGLPGAVPPLDRGAGPVEWLYLANRLDDLAGLYSAVPANGYTDDGWDGLDNDLDGLVDEDDEWEAEVWAPGATVTPSPYRIDRRPLVGGKARTTVLPAPVVVDATGWVQDALGARLRSQLPVDRFTGSVDLMFDGSGRVTTPTVYGRPATPPLNRPWVHLWIADRGDVVDPAATIGASGLTAYSLRNASRAAVVSVHLDTGRIVTAAADGSDPEGVLLGVEGGGR